MIIRCWGSRGSIPVSGAHYDRYGGDTTCIEIVSNEGELIVIDAGSGIRCLGEELLARRTKRFDLLFTHAHMDHIMGLPFFAPVYQKDTEITVHGCPFGASSYRTILKGIMTAPYCPVEIRDIPASLTFDNIETIPFHIGSIHITPIHLSHPNGGLGYRFEENGKSFVFLTDNELEYTHPEGLKIKDYCAFSEGADLLIHDAESTPRDYNRGWGHSEFASAVDLGLKAKVKRLGLFHINQKRTDNEVDSMVESARKLVSKKKSDMDCFAVGKGFEISL